MDDLSEQVLAGQQAARPWAPPPLPEAPPDAPKLPDDLSASVWRSQMAGTTSGLLSATARLAQDLAPDRSADILRLERKTGFPSDLIERNYDELKRASDAADFDAGLWASRSPGVAQWMTANPHRAAVGKDDLDQLSNIEWLLRAPQAAAASSFAREDANRLSFQSGWRVLTPAERQRMDDLYGQAAEEGGFGAHSIPAQAIVGLGQYIPQFLGQARSSAAQAPVLVGAGAVGGAAIGSLAGGIGAAPGAAAGAVIGLKSTWMVGAFLHGFEQEAGGAIREFRQMKDEAGQPMDDGAARMAGLAAGLLSAPLDIVEVGLILRTLPGASVLVGKVSQPMIKQVLMKPTIRLALANAAKTYAGTLAAESAQEMAQRAVVIMAGELAKLTSGTGGEPRAAGDIAADIAQEGKQALTSFALPVAAGPALRVARATEQVRQSQARTQLFEALGKGLEASKTMQRAPEAVREIVAQITKDGPIENVYVPAEAWNRYWQERKIDPRAAYAQVTGDTAAYDHSIASDTDVVIPTADFAARLAPTEHYQGLAQDIKLSDRPDELTQREAATLTKTMEETAEKAEKAAAQEKQEAVPKAIAQLEQDMIAAGTPPESAQVYAKGLWEGPLTNLAQREGLEIDELAKMVPRVVRGLEHGAKVSFTQEVPRATAIELRGPIPDAFKQDAEGYHYHATNLERAREIAVAGIKPHVPSYGTDQQVWPDGGTERRSYFGTPDNAWQFAPEEGKPVVLRVARVAGEFKRESTGDFFSTKKIPAKNIEVLTTTGWKPLSAFRGQEGELDQSNLYQTDGIQEPSIDTARGYVDFGDGQQITIGLLEKADPSTFIHESGHVFLEILRQLAARDGASAQLKADWQTAQDYLGAKPGEAISVEQHETWARSIEAYVMEGKAPSSALREVFARMAAWLKWVYRKISLEVTLTPQVREVMDRLFASDEQIEAAKLEHAPSPLFADAAAAKMDEATFDAYRKRLEGVAAQGRDLLRWRLMRVLLREDQEQWKVARGKMRALVQAEANEMPVYRALAALRRNQQPDGAPLPLPTAPRLSKDSIVTLAGQDVLKALRGLYSVQDGLDVEHAAGLWGFASPREMIEALAVAIPQKAYVDGVTDQRMREKYGDPMTDGTAMQLATEALYSTARDDVLRMEIAALAKLVSAAAPERVASALRRRLGVDQIRSAMKAPSDAQLRQMAAGMIGLKQVRDVKPNVYLMAARQSAKRAIVAAAKGEYLEAAQAKQQELLNNALYRSALEAIEQADDTAAFMRGFQETKKRAALGKAGADYLDQIDALTARFEFAMVPFKTLDKRQALLEFVHERERLGETLGEEIQVPQRLVDEALRVNYRTLTVDELRGLREFVTQLATLARLKNKLLAQAKRRDWEETRAELIAQARATLSSRGPQPLTIQGATTAESIAIARDGWDASLLKPERLFEWLDGGKIGPWHDALFNPASDAQSAEYDLTEQVAAKVAAIAQQLPKEQRARMNEAVAIEGIPRMVRAEAMGAVLNMGSESSLSKLQEGMGYSEATTQAILDSLSKEEMDTVQALWDALDTLKGPIWALQKELTGLEPESVEARVVNTKHGDYRGGYYPLFYSGAQTKQGQMQLGTTIGNLTEASYVRATTPRGHLITRTDFSAPLDLNIERLSSSLAGVIKDLTHRKWLLDANKISSDRQIRAAIIDTMGEAYVSMLDGWVRGVANDRNSPSSYGLDRWVRMFNAARQNIAIVGLGFRPTVWFSQFAGIGTAIGEVGAGTFLKGVNYFYQRPVSRMHRMRELSGEMRNRGLSYERNVREKLLGLMGKDSPWAQIQRAALYMIPFTEMLISAPTWWGTYNQARADNLDEAQAIHLADSAVRLSQGASGAKDVAAVVLRNDMLMSSLTMFFTPFSALYSQLRDIGHKMGRREDVALQFVRTFWVWPFAAVVASIATGNTPDDDAPPEEWARWLGKTVFVYPFMAIPFVRDVMSAWASEFGYQFTPLAQMGKTALRATTQMEKLVSGEGDAEAVAKVSLDVAKYLTGAPINQLMVTGDYLYDLSTGEEQPESMGELAYYLIYRRKDD